MDKPFPRHDLAQYLTTLDIPIGTRAEIMRKFSESLNYEVSVVKQSAVRWKKMCMKAQLMAERMMREDFQVARKTTIEVLNNSLGFRRIT